MPTLAYPSSNVRATDRGGGTAEGFGAITADNGAKTYPASSRASRSAQKRAFEIDTGLSSRAMAW